MAKFIHVSDICLGRQFSGIGQAGDFVRKALKDSLEALVTQALDRSVDFVLVSGNLFATNLVSRHLVTFTLGQIERLGKIPFVIYPGALDCLDQHSIYRYLPYDLRPDNLLVVSPTETPYFQIPDSEFTFYGMPIAPGSDNDWTGTIPPKQDFPGFHIAVVTGRSTGEQELEGPECQRMLDALEVAGFDYIAVGGATSRKWNNHAYSCGSPESVSFDGSEPGGIVMVDLNPGQLSQETIQPGQLNWKRLDLDNTNFHYNIEVEEELLKHASPQTIMWVHFDGEFVPDGYLDLGSLEAAFADRFCFLRIEDARRYNTEHLQLAGGNRDALQTDYLLLLEEAIDKAAPELKPKYLQALVTGNAMLSGKDVIS